LAQKCIRLVREKLTAFLYGLYITGIDDLLVSEGTVKFEVDVGVCNKYANM